MKKLINYFAGAAVVALALVSCAKELETENFEKGQAKDNEPEIPAVTITVHAAADELANEDKEELKTYIDTYQGTANTILWGTGEYMKLAVTAGESTTFVDSSESSKDSNSGTPEKTFAFSVSVGSASEYVYQGLYPASAAVASSNTNAASYKVKLPEVQNASPSSYDPSAYILVAKPNTFSSIQENWNAEFLRATALNKITLKNIPSGVSIKRVTITAPTGKYLAGSRHINLTETGRANVMGEIYNGGGRTETVEVKFDTPQAGGANFDVWFTSWDVEVLTGETLTIVAYSTDKKSYTKTIEVPANKSILFKEGYLNTLIANMSGVPVADVTELEAGDYVILAKSGDNYYAMKAETTSNDTRMASVDYSGSLSSYSGASDMIWSVSKSGSSYILENSDKYLGYSGTENKAFWNEPGNSWTETNYLIDIAWDGTNNCYHATLNSNGNRKLSRNSGSDWFAFYTSDQQKDLIFVPATVDNRTDVTLSFNDNTVELTNATGSYDQFLGQNLTISPSNVTAISENLVWTYEDNDGIIDEFDEGALTLTGDIGTATVTVSFAGDATYKAATASYTITVTDASSSTEYYEKVTTDLQDWSGEYLFVYESGSLALDGSLTTLDVQNNTISVDISNNKIERTATTEASSFTVAAVDGGYSICSASGYYIGSNSASSNVLTSNTTYSSSLVNTFSVLSGSVTIKGNVSKYLTYNTSASRFRYYGSGSVGVYRYVDNTVWDLKSIAVTTAPTKTTYEAGEFFDPTGMVVTATYEDHAGVKADKTEIIANNDLTFSPSTSTALTTSDTDITITYNSKSTSQAITVTAPITWDLKSIAVTTAPTKITYTAGENFDPTGMVVTATYENHDNTSQTKDETVDNANLTFTPSTSTALATTDTSVTISYTVSGITQTTTQAITVNAASNDRYVKVTSLSDVTAGEYIIVSNNTYLPNASTSSAPAAVAVTITNNEVQNVTDAMTWTFTGTTSKMTIQSTVSGTPYLYTTTSNNGVRVGATTGDWTIAVNNSGFSLKFNSTNRYCATTTNNGGDWRSYDSATSQYYLDSGQVYLYKLADNTVWNLKSIAVTTPPTKTSYEAGENFDPTGMVVTATYEDQAGVKADKTETIANNELTFSPALNAALTVQNTSVTISYSGQTTTQNITVTAPITWDLKSIAVTTPPTKTTYTAGEYFNPAGLVVTATFENHNNTSQTKNETVDNANLTFTPSTSTALTTSNASVTISYTVSGITKTTTQAITVNSASSSVTGEIYHENFGSPSGNTAIGSFTGWEKGGSLSQSAVTYSYSGSTTTPIRKTSPSSGYTGASGNGSLYTAAGGALTVSNINVTGAKYITFSCGTQATSANTVVTYKFNTQSSNSSLAATTSKTTGPSTWGLVSYTKLEVPSGATSLTLVITINSASRIDDLKIDATDN